jgi:hypothetical protein
LNAVWIQTLSWVRVYYMQSSAKWRKKKVGPLCHRIKGKLIVCYNLNVKRYKFFFPPTFIFSIMNCVTNLQQRLQPGKPSLCCFFFLFPFIPTHSSGENQSFVILMTVYAPLLYADRLPAISFYIGMLYAQQFIHFHIKTQFSFREWIRKTWKFGEGKHLLHQ